MERLSAKTDYPVAVIKNGYAHGQHRRKSNTGDLIYDMEYENGILVYGEMSRVIAEEYSITLQDNIEFDKMIYEFKQSTIKSAR